MPVLVLAALCLPQIKRAAIFVGGVAAGFLIPVLPFAIAGPSQLYHSLITAQVGYRAHAVRVGVLLRLRNMIGFPYALGWSKSLLLLAVLALVIFVVVAQAAAILVTQQPPPTLDWFARRDDGADRGHVPVAAPVPLPLHRSSSRRSWR